MGRPLVADKESDSHIYQPLVKDIVDMGEDEYSKLVLPYVVTTDSIFNGVENEEELINKYDLFDLFFVNVEEGKTILDSIFSGENSLKVLIDSMRYFLKSDDIRVLHKRQKIVVNDSYLIDKNEFSKLRRLIQAVTGRNDIEVEKPPKNMSKRQKDIWIKLQKGRKRSAEKNSIYMQDIVNYVSFGGSSYISTEQIDNMTYYYLQNAYKSIVGMDSYNMGMAYKLSPKFDIKDDIKHWTQTLKIGK